MHTARENKANRLQKSVENPVFDNSQQHLRWSRFVNIEATKQYELVVEAVFPFMRGLGSKGSAFARHMENARFTLPPERAGLLSKVIDMIDKIPMNDRDTKGDLYEYLLSKLSTSGQNGQFRTPRHIIKMMVAMTAPTPRDIICDPALGTAGFLVATAENLYDNYREEIFADDTLRALYDGKMFHGFDFDATMLRIASMNMMLHGIENPIIENRDSLSEDNAGAEDLYNLILANPPFKGSLDADSTAKNLLATVKTKKTELLFIALFLRLLKPGGRAAVIVPDGVLFGSSKAHKTLRRMLVEDHRLDGIVSMPSGVFKPYAGVSTAVVFFTKTNSGGTENVWFYDMQADGFSLDDKRNALGEDHEHNNIPDILTRWQNRAAEAKRARTEQSFLVPKAEIVENDYDLSINRYKEIVYEEIEYDPPQQILDELEQLEKEIQSGLQELRGMIE